MLQGGSIRKNRKYLTAGKIPFRGKIARGRGPNRAQKFSPWHPQGGSVMIRKILFCASVGGMLLMNVPLMAHSRTAQEQSGKQSQQAAKSVAGKITSIGEDRRSFVVEVDNGGAKQNMQFVLDKNSQVEGRVTTGTMVLVEYQPMNGDQNLCLKVSARQG
jgi:hypothetical protein